MRLCSFYTYINIAARHASKCAIGQTLIKQQFHSDWVTQ
jgi:hypothetical protein